MKRISLLLVTVLVCMISSAQVTWNVKAGAGFSSVRGDYVDNVTSKFGWKIGVGVEKPISANWLIMPSLEYKEKGTRYDGGASYYDIDYHFLQLPILGAYRIHLSDEINMTLKGGPYFAYELGGEGQWDAGLLLGVDFEYHRFVLGAEYEYGMLSCEDVEGEVYNYGLYVTLGYKF